jgi:nucleotide-binding universal stress UspA family protein
MNLMLQKILIAIGDSSASQEVLKAGFTLAEKFGAQILILHVLNILSNGFETMTNPLMGGTYPIVNDLAIQQYQQELQAREQRGLEQLKLYAEQASNLKIKAEILQTIGDPARVICETAKDGAVDLIVVGRNQKSVLSEIFLGSTSNYVLHHAPCSVMVIQ